MGCVATHSLGAGMMGFAMGKGPCKAAKNAVQINGTKGTPQPDNRPRDARNTICFIKKPVLFPAHAVEKRQKGSKVLGKSWAPSADLELAVFLSGRLGHHRCRLGCAASGNAQSCDNGYCQHNLGFHDHYS